MSFFYGIFLEYLFYGIKHFKTTIKRNKQQLYELYLCSYKHGNQLKISKKDLNVDK